MAILLRAPVLPRHSTEVCVSSMASTELLAQRNLSACGASSSSTSSVTALSLSLSPLLSTSSQPWSRGVALVQRNGRRAQQQHEDKFFGCRASYVSGSGALTPQLKEALDNFISTHKVILFMKGNRNFPQCGFSNTCVQILNQFQVPYETVNILEDESLRQGVKEYSNWPTYPQLYIDGEFFGGCDITLDAYQSGELKEAIDKAILS